MAHPTLRSADVTTPYMGRFAPSPTGPLHFGSLLAATASYLEAHAHQGQWLVRMEDLDQARCIAGAADHILHTLEAFGFEWQGAVLYQSQRTEAYAAALAHLNENNWIYPCACTRREIADSSTVQHGIDGIIYPGTCRNGLGENKTARAWRVKVEQQDIAFLDAIQGNICQNLAKDVGDYILKRADGPHAYQLAVVVDDAEQNISHIVRGADLLDSTPRQIYLQQRLQMPIPSYAHIPVASNTAGEKLSKQTLAKPLDNNKASELLFNALTFLNQDPPTTLEKASLTEIWQWAKQHWAISKIPKQRSIVRVETS